MNSIGYYLLHTVILAMYAVVLLPLTALADQVEKQAGPRALLYGIYILTGLWLGVALWMSHQTAKKMTFENLTFKKATIASYYDTRLYLAFLPIVGKYFQPKEKDKDNARRKDIYQSDAANRR